MEASIDFLSEDTLIVRFAPPANDLLLVKIKALVDGINQHCASAIIEMVPSYTTVLVQFDIFCLTHTQLEQHIKQALAGLTDNADQHSSPKLIQIPVCYDSGFALDIDELASQLNLSVDEIINLHKEPIYTVYAIGFCPGFAFLGNVSNAITAPRKSTPRARVPAGSVGIANQQTAVYPMDSPGGWNIIGRSPMQLVDYSLPALCPFRIGDRVKFSAISLEEYHFLKGSEQ